MRFGRRIVPGLLPASMATHLGGLWGFLATEMHLEFLAPVYVGDTITLDVEIVAVEGAKQKVKRSQPLDECRWRRSLAQAPSRASRPSGTYAPEQTANER